MAAIAVPNFANVAISADYLAQIAPRPILLTRGLWEWGTEGAEAQFSREHVQETKDMVAHAHETLRPGRGAQQRIWKQSISTKPVATTTFPLRLGASVTNGSKNQLK